MESRNRSMPHISRPLQSLQQSQQQIYTPLSWFQCLKCLRGRRRASSCSDVFHQGWRISKERHFFKRFLKQLIGYPSQKRPTYGYLGVIRALFILFFFRTLRPGHLAGRLFGTFLLRTRRKIWYSIFLNEEKSKVTYISGAGSGVWSSVNGFKVQTTPLGGVYPSPLRSDAFEVWLKQPKQNMCLRSFFIFNLSKGPILGMICFEIS